MLTKRTLCFDLDGCLYKSKRLYPIFDAATARAGLTLGLPLTFAQALKVNQEAQEKGELFPLVYLNEYGIPLPDLLREYHALLDENTLLSPNPDLVDAFEKLGETHFLLTHGNRDWAVRSLTRIGIKDFFLDENIFALEDYGYELKTQSERGFRMVQDRAGRKPHEMLMIEDSHRNLVIPHRIGWKTALVHYGAPKNPRPEHVHTQHETPIALIDALIMEQNINFIPEPSQPCFF